jgi:hypothetical protein
MSAPLQIHAHSAIRRIATIAAIKALWLDAQAGQDLLRTDQSPPKPVQVAAAAQTQILPAPEAKWC